MGRKKGPTKRRSVFALAAAFLAITSSCRQADAFTRLSPQTRGPLRICVKGNSNIPTAASSNLNFQRKASDVSYVRSRHETKLQASSVVGALSVPYVFCHLLYGVLVKLCTQNAKILFFIYTAHVEPCRSIGRASPVTFGVPTSIVGRGVQIHSERFPFRRV